MKKIIPIHEPVFVGNEIKYLNSCITQGWVSTAGKFINLFEKKISKITKSKYALATNSCTSSLFLSLMLAGVKPNDEILISNITFISPINTILYNNAIPVFMDCDTTLNIDINKTKEFLKFETFTRKINNKIITFNKKTNRKISALIIVHTFGNPANILPLIDICKKKNIKIIEDAAESLGSYISTKYERKHLGTLGDFGCISFNGNKIATTGGGGVILINNKKIHERLLHLSSQSKIDSVNFKHDNIGFNLRMNNIQAAIGLAQLENLPKFLLRKKKIHDLYKRIFYNNNNYSILSNNLGKSNNWINILQFNNKKIKKEEIFKNFKKNFIQTRSIWLPNNNQSFLRKYQSYKITMSKKLFDSMICLPSSYNLKDGNIKKICNIIINSIK